MPFYSEPQHNVRVSVPIVFGGTTGTSTASGVNALVGALTVPFKPIRAMKVSNVRVRVGTAPAANLTVVTLSLLNGTATFASAVVGTHTAGEFVDATITAANANLAADVQPTLNLAGTATASGMASGVYDIFAELTESYV